MNKKSLGGAVNSAKTYSANEKLASFSSLDYGTNELDKQSFIGSQASVLAGQVFRLIKREPKIVRCVRCLGCGKAYAPSKMSAILVLCKPCAASAQGKGLVARSNFIDRLTNNFRIFLRRKI